MSGKNIIKGVLVSGVFLFFGLFLYANTASNPGILSGLVFFPWRHNNNGGTTIVTPATIGPKINHFFMGATIAGAFPVFDQQAGFVDIWKASGVHSYDPNLLASMNWSHWQGNGLGMVPSEIASAGNTDPNMINWANKTATLNWKHWERFTAFMQAFGPDAKLYALGNIRTQSVSGTIALLPTDDASNQLAITENVGMIADAKAKGLNVDKWLAGVELSDKGVRPALNNDPQTYVTRAKAVSLGVKAVYPTMKVVVGLLNPLNATKDPFITDWNTKVLNSNTGTNKWFDYAGIYMVMDNDENVEQTCTTGDTAIRFNCFKDISHHYTSNIPAKLDARMSAYPGYKMVVNSWGTDNNGAAPGFSFSSYSANNTMAQALFTADFMAGVMKYNASHNNIVESMYYLNGVGDNRAAISKYNASSDDVGNVQKIGTSMVKRTTMHVFELFASLFDGNHKILDTNTLTLPTGIIAADVSVLGAKDTTTNKLTYIVSNWTGQSLSVQDIKINNVSIIPTGKSVQSQSMYGTALSSSYGEKNFTGTFSPITLTALQSVQNPTSMSVRPYSVTKISISN
jgi:hypothetical protein